MTSSTTVTYSPIYPNSPAELRMLSLLILARCASLPDRQFVEKDSSSTCAVSRLRDLGWRINTLLENGVEHYMLDTGNKHVSDLVSESCEVSIEREIALCNVEICQVIYSCGSVTALPNRSLDDLCRLVRRRSDLRLRQATCFRRHPKRREAV